MTDIAHGAFVEKGSDLYLIETRVPRDPLWKCAGWRALRLGGGMTWFLPDHLLDRAAVVTIGEWRALPGGVESRWVYDDFANAYRREVRKAAHHHYWSPELKAHLCRDCSNREGVAIHADYCEEPPA